MLKHFKLMLCLAVSLGIEKCLAQTNVSTEVKNSAEAVSGNPLEPAHDSKSVPKPADVSFIEMSDVPGLSQFLPIGDSISMGSTLPVREKFKGRANVHRPPENCGDTARGLARLSQWLGWDTVSLPK